MATYYVDYENVHNGGMKGIEEVGSNDLVYVFYSAVANTMTVRRHIVGGANCTLFSVNLPPRLCRTGTCRRLQTE